MSISEAAREVLGAARTMRLATVGEDGGPNVAAFWFLYDRDRICFATVENATMRNLRRDPRVALVVDVGDGISELRSVAVKGEAAVYAPREAPSELRRAIRSMNERWAEEIRSPVYEAYVRHEKRAPVLVEVTVQSASQDAESSDAVRCARYHCLSNALGGLRMRYAVESADKAWVFYETPAEVEIEDARGVVRVDGSWLDRSPDPWEGGARAVAEDAIASAWAAWARHCDRSLSLRAGGRLSVWTAERRD